MNTQRVNIYIAGSGKPVYYIQEFFDDPYGNDVAEWLTVGDTYDSFALAEVTVNLHNAKLVLDELLKLKGGK